MPSVPHEMLVELLATSPQLLQQLLGTRLDAVVEADGALRPERLCIRRGQATTSQLPVLSADLGLELYRPSTTHPSVALTVEIQLTRDDDKPYSWIPYLGGQVHRLQVPAYLLVVTNDPSIAAWAAGPFRAGHLTLEPWVLGPGDIPAITRIEDARHSLDMTLFSGIVHGREKVAVPIGLVLRRALDEAPDDVGIYYWDAFLASLSEPFRKELDMLLPTFRPRSDWSKEIYAKGQAKGRIEDILVLLALRGIGLTPRLRRRIHECTDLAQLDRWFRNAATAKSIEAVFDEGAPPPSGKAAMRRSSLARSRVRERPRA